uniref:Uncharacterized protein LOC104245850 n=1 Tax=Nicotiana sylvestris TaxID=4096 RepID=A0A1U7YLY9_NICSY|nr:PREDICTED: uncharacterized protein LOC104245850 [Nicotiana sylvestris]
MAGNREVRMKAVVDLITNLLNTINEVSEMEGEDVMPNASPRHGCSSFLKWAEQKRFEGNNKVTELGHKIPLTTWDEIHNAYCAEVRTDKDDLNGLTQWLTSVQGESRKDRRNDAIIDLAAPRLNQERHQPSIRDVVMPLARHEEEIVYALENLGLKVKWPQKTRSDPITRKSNAICEIHQERGHKIEDCIALRQEVVNMLHRGHLKELLSDQGRGNFSRGLEQHQGLPKSPSLTRTIQMIIEGGDGALINSVKFITTHKLKRSITHERYDELEESIVFDKSDTHGLVFPHYDALVITLQILDTDVKCIIVDDGSGACIIHPRVLVQMKLEDKIVPCCITLTGFNDAIERTSGETTLPVLTYDVTLETTFHIMDQDT